MGKKKTSYPAEEYLSLSRSATTKIVDTHTHIASTYETYRSKYPNGKYQTVYDFVKGIYKDKNVDAIIDVWCEAPVRTALWREFADSALKKEDRESKWGGIDYWFVIGQLPSQVLC